ncbi:M56 family metallopeptidase [Acidobacteriota bacterium]
MDTLLASTQPFFGWLLQTTLCASVVIGLILLLQKVLGRRLGPRWTHALWLVLLIRMVLPGTIPGQIDLLDLVPSLGGQIQQQSPSDIAEQEKNSQATLIVKSDKTIPVHKPESDVGNLEQAVPRQNVLAQLNTESKPWSLSIRRAVPFIWLAGALVVGLFLFLNNFFLWRIVKRERPLVDQKILELFEECKERMGVHTLAALIVSTRIKNPALFGFVRPRLLMPKEMLEELSQEEMRYIFLHELAHLKRHDIYLGWLTSLLQILHWFNPLVWFAFYRIRTDRELSCDAFVLSRTGKDKSQEYGQAILGLLRRFSRSRPLPAMAGILENRSQLKRRITMISQFKTKNYQWSPHVIILILFLSFVSLSFSIGIKTQTTYLPKSEPSISLRRVDTGPISDFSGPPSLDGRYICDIERPHLVVLDFVTGEKRQLTEVSSWGMWRPVLSPGSEYVAYLDQTFPPVRHELRLIKMDGTGQRVLHRFDVGDNLWKHTWTPDGKQILGIFKRGKEDRQLVSFSAADGSKQVIYTFEEDKHSGDNNLTVSPDNRFVAFERAQEKGSELMDIYILSIEDGQTNRVVKNEANDKILGWTPDQSRLLFASDRKQGYPGTYSISDTWDAYLLPVADGKQKGPPELINRNIPAKIRPKGFTRDGAFYYAVEFSTMEAAVAEVDLQTGKLLSKPYSVGQTGSDVAPAWSPDGRFLAYCIQMPDESQLIRIRDMQTDQEREIDPDLPHFRWLQWTPDGRSFLASNFVKADEQAIYRVDGETGEREVLVQGESNKLDVARFSPDGRSLFYVLHDQKEVGAGLMVRDMESGQESELFSVPGASYRGKYLTFDFSPDGEKLALGIFKLKLSDGKAETERSVLTMPIQGGEPRELVKSTPQGAQYPAVTWTPDGQFILFTDTLPEGGNAVFIVPSAGGQARELCRPQTMTYGVLYSVLDIHPEGKRLAFDCFEYRHEVWAMDNFLPKMTAVKDK